MVPKKPKFLYLPSEFGEWLATLGRRLKSLKSAGRIDSILNMQHREIGQLIRKRNTYGRHFKWMKVYEPAFEAERARAISELGYSPRQAFKYARQKAENAVLDAFPEEVTSARAVRDAIKKHT